MGWVSRGSLTKAPYTIQTKITTGNGAGSADLVLANTTDTWHDLDISNGSATARPSDLVIPGVSADEWVTVLLSCFSNNGTGIVNLDFVTVVAGAHTNRFAAPATGGNPGWTIWGGGGFLPTNGSLSYQLQAGDIESGSVRLRPVYKKGAAARTIYAQPNIPVILEARGPVG